MNVAANAGASSSVLPMLPAHDHAAPEASYVDTEDVEVVTLDQLRGDLWHAGASVHLKADVQGYERYVLDGAALALADVQMLELELSFVPLYEGSMLIAEAIDHVNSLGFVLARLEQGWCDPQTQGLMQGNGLFFRRLDRSGEVAKR